MKRYVEGFVFAFLLAGCAGSHSGLPIPDASTPAQSSTTTLDRDHTSVSLKLQDNATVTVSLPNGVPPPMFPIAVRATAEASKLAIVTLTSSGAVTMAGAPIVTIHLATASSHRIIAESCSDSCTYAKEQIVLPTSPGTYTYQDSASVTLGGSHAFSVTFASLPNYQLVDLSAGAQFSGISPTAINDSDTIVATGNESGSGTGLVYSNGKWRTIPPPPGQSATQPFAISNTGVIVGASGNRAFRYSAGVSSALGQLQAVPDEISQSNTATAISEDGQHIAGYTHVETHIGVSFADYITATDFTAPGGPAPSACLNGRSVQGGHFNDSRAQGVNSAGTLVGAVTSSNTFGEDREIYACPVQQALGDGTTPGEALAINETGDIAGFLWPHFERFVPFLYSGGTISDLPIPANYSSAFASRLNDSDVIIGTVEASGPSSRSVVWRDGIVIFLNDLLPANCAGWTLNTATGINNRGDIVGMATNGSVSHAYMLQAMP